MGAGQPDHVLCNLKDLNQFEAGSEVTLESLKTKGVLDPSGKERRLPLKVRCLRALCVHLSNMMRSAHTVQPG